MARWSRRDREEQNMRRVVYRHFNAQGIQNEDELRREGRRENEMYCEAARRKRRNLG